MSQKLAWGLLQINSLKKMVKIEQAALFYAHKGVLRDTFVGHLKWSKWNIFEATELSHHTDFLFI